MFAELFDEILIWPLEIVTRSERPQDWVKWIVERSGGAWEQIKDLQRREETSSEQVSYGEFVYFHPFVQRFLYGIPADGDRKEGLPLRLLRRKDVKKVAVEVRGQTGVFPRQVLDVRRVHLYLTTTRVAMLVVEVASQRNEEGLERDWILAFQDQFRHLYAPYWEGGKSGHCPEKVIWLDERGAAVGAPSDYERQAHHLQDVFECKRPPVAAHWRFLLGPMVHYDESANAGAPGEVCFRQIEDERIPVMCYLAHPRPAGITRGDFVRLAFCDGGGNERRLSYSTDFLADFEKKYCYDRFWDPRTQEHWWMATRYLCSGYALTVVGAANDWFFTNPLLEHFRHHYFQVGLIVQFHKASLLVFSDRLAKAVTRLPDEDRFHEEVKKLQSQIAEFVSRFWFEEISNELQAYELFRWWSDLVGNPHRFQQVMTEVRLVADTLFAIQGERREKEAGLLSTIAAVGVPVVCFLTALTVPEMAPLIQKWTLRISPPPPGLSPMQWTTFFGVFVSAVVFRVGLLLYRKWRK